MEAHSKEFLQFVKDQKELGDPDAIYLWDTFQEKKYAALFADVVEIRRVK